MLYVHAILQGTAAAAATAYPEQDVSGGPATQKRTRTARSEAGVAVSGIDATSPNVPKKTRAAIYVADDRLSDNEIADELNMNRRTLTRWRNEPEFMELVAAFEQELNAETMRYPIARRRDRIKTLNELHDDLLFIKRTRAARIREELARGDDAVNATRRIFGDVTPEEAMSGLMVREESVSASGLKTVNYRLDNALVKAIADLQKQAAQDTGQWSDNQNVNVDGGMRLEIVGMAEEDLP